MVLDIEGTVAPISFVYDVMFPYAKKKLRSYLEKNWDTAEMQHEDQELQAEVSPGIATSLTCMSVHVWVASWQCYVWAFMYLDQDNKTG